MRAQIIQWQTETEGFALFGPVSVLRPEDASDFHARAPYGFTLAVGEVDLDRLVLIDRGPKGTAEPRETPVTVWSLEDQREKLGAEASAKEAERDAADAVAAARPGADGAKVLAIEARKAEIRAVLAEEAVKR